LEAKNFVSRWWVQHTALWINNSHKDKDIFMPSDWAKKKGASSKSKQSTSSKTKGRRHPGAGILPRRPLYA
jgi:hypothetical protein